ncbi:hypothetical protein [Streptomyces lydicus]|uniref:hypothetical protein n=1 Tax=Streptomyces lydicus TaxID=47763 RepID=UPI00287000F1|nr:hypothetical protein [Streptomyces lydicus]
MRHTSTATALITVGCLGLLTSEKGGTLVYVDGNGDAFRWKIPAASSRDAASALKSALT